MSFDHVIYFENFVDCIGVNVLGVVLFWLYYVLVILHCIDEVYYCLNLSLFIYILSLYFIIFLIVL